MPSPPVELAWVGVGVADVFLVVGVAGASELEDAIGEDDARGDVDGAGATEEDGEGVEDGVA